MMLLQVIHKKEIKNERIIAEKVNKSTSEEYEKRTKKDKNTADRKKNSN